MTTIIPQLLNVVAAPLVAEVFQTCVLSSPDQVDPVDPVDPEEPGTPPSDEDNWAPIPPTLDPAPPDPTFVVIDTSPSQVIGCIYDVGGNPQGRLAILFPSAIEGDGVVERVTNDFWVLRDGAWINVGPNPGPTIVDATVIPPYNESVLVNAITKNVVTINLATLTEDREDLVVIATLNSISVVDVGAAIVLQSGVLFTATAHLAQLEPRALPLRTLSTPRSASLQTTTTAFTTGDPVEYILPPVSGVVGLAFSRGISSDPESIAAYSSIKNTRFTYGGADVDLLDSDSYLQQPDGSVVVRAGFTYGNSGTSFITLFDSFGEIESGSADYLEWSHFANDFISVFHYSISGGRPGNQEFSIPHGLDAKPEAVFLFSQSGGGYLFGESIMPTGLDDLTRIYRTPSSGLINVDQIQLSSTHISAYSTASFSIPFNASESFLGIALKNVAGKCRIGRFTVEEGAAGIAVGFCPEIVFIRASQDVSHPVYLVRRVSPLRAGIFERMDWVETDTAGLGSSEVNRDGFIFRAPTPTPADAEYVYIAIGSFLSNGPIEEPARARVLVEGRAATVLAGTNLLRPGRSRVATRGRERVYAGDSRRARRTIVLAQVGRAEVRAANVYATPPRAITASALAATITVGQFLDDINFQILHLATDDLLDMSG